MKTYYTIKYILYFNYFYKYILLYFSNVNVFTYLYFFITKGIETKKGELQN